MHYDKDMVNIVQMDNGDKLYHYTTSDALINIVINKEFWITKWDYLNDMDELRVAEEVCEAILNEENVDLEVVKAIRKETNKIICEDLSFFILSFSCDKDSQLLWSNYANLDGLNLEIDFDKFEKRLNHIIKWHGLVNYHLESQKECMRKTFHDELINVEDFGKIKSLNDINMLTGKEYEMLITHISVICVVYSMFFKREYFKGENEYRFVFSSVNKDGINFRSRNGLIIPYIKKKVEELDFITKITIGPTNKIDIATNGIRELLHHNEREIEVAKSEIPLRF
ncbi:MAG: hypothetical protein Q4A78_07510 [Peptostreptococcaceae bacterium]|nr:hypothetical protein [Peptostreptococcaceae bacterium]